MAKTKTSKRGVQEKKIVVVKKYKKTRWHNSLWT